MVTVLVVFVDGFPVLLGRDAAGRWWWGISDREVPVRAGQA